MDVKDTGKRGEFLEELKKILIHIQEVDNEIAILEFTYKEEDYKRVLSNFESTKVKMDNLLTKLKK